MKDKNNISKLSTNKHPSIDLPTEKLPSVASSLPMQAKNRTDNKPRLVNFVVRGLCLGVFIGLAIFGIFYAWSWSVSTSKAQPEAFTELYFEDAPNLPSKVVPNHPYLFQFTLHNLEGKDMEYSYQAYVQVGQYQIIFDKGAVLVRDNDYKTIQETFTPRSVLPQSQVVVDLINKNQQIDFWVEGSA